MFGKKPKHDNLKDLSYSEKRRVPGEIKKHVQIDEKVTAVAGHTKFTWRPDNKIFNKEKVISTSESVYIEQKSRLGTKKTFTQIQNEDIINKKIEKGILGAKITIETQRISNEDNGKNKYEIKGLPKGQADKLYHNIIDRNDLVEHRNEHTSVFRFGRSKR